MSTLDDLTKLVTSTLANPTDPTKGAALIGFTQSGTDAVSRTVSSKLQEWISVTDFGAVGDGVTDDTDHERHHVHSHKQNTALLA
jgi:hypothetical protein